MTKRQAETLAFIKSFIAEHGYSPTLAEIGAGIGLKGKSGVSRLVHSLARMNKVLVRPYRQRAITVIDGIDRIEHRGSVS